MLRRQLLGRANSSNVMKVIWLLEELGLPYEREDRGGPYGGTDTPDYRAMNPTGLVPTLVEDDFVLWESNAILRYLAHANAGDAPIWPHEPRARANIDRWMDWQQTIMNRPGSVVFQGLVRIAPEKRDNMAIERALGELSSAWLLIDDVLERHDYVAGDHFTLADISLGVHVHRWFFFPVPKPETPNLHRWYERLLARPAYKQHCAGPVT